MTPSLSNSSPANRRIRQQGDLAPTSMTTSLPNYRKLAFDEYAHICVYCGFGIPEVLEVAHLDGNRANNSEGISIGGGLATLGSEWRIKIKRISGNGQTYEVPASLDDQVEAGDTIIVSERIF